MASLKILHVLDHSVPLHSGYTFRSQNIFRVQQSFGWKPVVLTSPKHEQSWKHRTASLEEINKVRYHRTGPLPPVAGRLPVLPDLLLVRVLRQRLQEVLDVERPDIIHAHSPFLNALACLRLSRKYGLPLVYEIRAFWEDAAVDHGSYAQSSLKYRLVRAMETKICRQADQVTILCNGLKQDLIDRGISRDKITVVFNGINPDDFTPHPPDEEFIRIWDLQDKTVLGFIGSFYHYEGLDLLVSAFAQLAPAYPNLVLLLVGGGPMEDRLRRQIEKLGLQARVRLPGRVAHEQIPRVYSLFDVLVYPRYSMRLTELVTPLKPLEAMAMSKVLLASDIGGHRELITDGVNGFLFPAGDRDRLSRALEQLLMDPSLMKQVGLQSRQWVLEHHAWTRTLSVYRDVYAGLLGREV